MVVDDAVVVRALVSRWIDEEPGLEARRLAAHRPRGGRSARAASIPTWSCSTSRCRDLDGIATLPLLLEKKRDLVVIMASALTRDNAEVTLKALSLGAADYIPKPEAEGGVMTSASFQRELIEKIRALGARRPPARRCRRPMRGAAPRRPRAGSPARSSGSASGACPAPADQSAFELRPFSPRHAARAADRRLDRRAAGAHQAGRAARRGHRPRAGADHPAHAADLHHHPGRASGARQRQAGARGGGRRAGAGRARSISRPAAGTCGWRAATAPR